MMTNEKNLKVPSKVFIKLAAIDFAIAGSLLAFGHKEFSLVVAIIGGIKLIISAVSFLYQKKKNASRP